MNELGLGIYIVPTMALVLVILIYIYFSKKAADIQNYRRFIITIGAVGFILNLIWELVQGPLYKDYKYDWNHIPFCVLASITDMLTLLLLLFGFGLVYKNIFWVRRLSISRVSLLMLAGGLGSIFLEMWHINRGDWSYAESMPLIPIVKAGVSPVLQFTLLPLVIFVLSRRVLKKSMKALEKKKLIE